MAANSRAPADVTKLLHEAVSSAVYLRSPDAAGVVALLLRQGERVAAEDNETYAKLTGLTAQILEDKRLKAMLPHAALLRVKKPIELSQHLVAAAEKAGEARMHELRSAESEEYVEMTGLYTQLDAAIESAGLRSSSPPADALERLAAALVDGSSPGAATLPPGAATLQPSNADVQSAATRQANQQRAATHTATRYVRRDCVESTEEAKQRALVERQEVLQKLKKENRWGRSTFDEMFSMLTGCRPPQQYSSSPTPEAKHASSFGWSASSWAETVKGVPAAIAAALLLGSASRTDDLAAIRELASSLSSPDELAKHLREARLIEDLAGCLFPALKKLQSAKDATASEFYDKFTLEGNAPVLSYSGLEAFFGGLEKIIGPPSANVLEAMRTEHCGSDDSKIDFETKNYELRTTSEIEWMFVTEPTDEQLKALGLKEWPVEQNIARAQHAQTENRLHLHPALKDLLACGAKPRVVVPVAELEERRQIANELLELLNEPLLIKEEIFGARLYTGPLFMKYNAVMRGVDTDVEFLQNQMKQLCCSREDRAKAFSVAKQKANTYVTTLHVINSAIVKLSKLTKVSKVYRGVSGMRLPASFMEANNLGVRGGIEPAFMSTSLNREVALEYAGGKDVGLVLEIQQGMVSRGADISFVSQYPHEEEVRSSVPLSQHGSISILRC